MAARVGPMHTAAVYVNLFSLMQSGRVKAGERIAMFSYGSGAASSLFSVRVVAVNVSGEAREDATMDGKLNIIADEFKRIAKKYSSRYGRFGCSLK